MILTSEQRYDSVDNIVKLESAWILSQISYCSNKDVVNFVFNLNEESGIVNKYL